MKVKASESSDVKLAGVYEVKRPVAAGKEVDPRLLAKLC